MAVNSVLYGNQAHDLYSAHFDADRKFPHTAHRITEFGNNKFIAPVQCGHKLFPLRTHYLMVRLFLNHLYTTEIQHPFLVCLVCVIVVSLIYVSYFCHCEMLKMITCAKIIF